MKPQISKIRNLLNRHIFDELHKINGILCDSASLNFKFYALWTTEITIKKIQA